MHRDVHITAACGVILYVVAILISETPRKKKMIMKHIVRPAAQGPVWQRGWWGARAAHDAYCACWGALLLLCTLLRLRSGFVPLLWALLPALADLAAAAFSVAGTCAG